MRPITPRALRACCTLATHWSTSWVSSIRPKQAKAACAYSSGTTRRAYTISANDPERGFDLEYSKVKSVKAVNVRSIGAAQIEFTKPIIALTGTNESGKSSFIRAIGMVAGNLWRTKQGQYIRTGQEGLAVLLELEDGTKILRKKAAEVNAYTLVMPDGSRRDANKIATDIPDFVTAVMGMSRDPETGESLQVRTYDDPLLFVGTTDGQNYKVLHNAINNLDVREATNKAKADAARLAGEASEKRKEAELYNRQLSEIPLLDTVYLETVLSATERAAMISEKFDAALKALKDTQDYVDNTQQLVTVNPTIFRLLTEAKRHLDVLKADSVITDGAETVDIRVLSRFIQAKQHLMTVRDCNTVDVPAEVKPIPGRVLSLFSQARQHQKTIRDCDATDVPSEVKTVSVEALSLFERAIQCAKEAREAGEMVAKLTDYIDRVSAAIKASGVRVVRCDQCGNSFAVV